MLKIPIKDVNMLAKEQKDIRSIFINNLYQYKRYVRDTFCPHIKFEPKLTLDLVDLNSCQYIGFNSSVLFETLCTLLNIKYCEGLEGQSEFEYYSLQFAIRIEELSKIKNENDLCMNFYQIYDLYQERKEKTEEALATYDTCAKLFPISEANKTRKKRLYKAQMTEKEYYLLLFESFTFNLPNFIQIITKELQFMVYSLPMLASSLINMSVPISTIKNIDPNKIARLIEIEIEKENLDSYKK